jgi:hypothetical protein
VALDGRPIEAAAYFVVGEALATCRSTPGRAA